MSDSHNPRQTAADLIEQIGKFDGDPSGFLQHILAAQCIVGGADGGAFLGSSQEQSVGVLALYPQHGKVAEAPSWLTGSVEVIREALSKDTMAVGQENGAGHVLVFPLKLPDVRVAAAAFLMTIPMVTALQTVSTPVLMMLTMMLTVTASVAT